MTIIQNENKPVCIDEVAPGELFREDGMDYIRMKIDETYNEDDHCFNCVILENGSLDWCCKSMVYRVNGAFVEDYQKKG